MRARIFLFIWLATHLNLLVYFHNMLLSDCKQASLKLIVYLTSCLACFKDVLSWAATARWFLFDWQWHQHLTLAVVWYLLHESNPSICLVLTTTSCQASGGYTKKPYKLGCLSYICFYFSANISSPAFNFAVKSLLFQLARCNQWPFVSFGITVYVCVAVLVFICWAVVLIVWPILIVVKDSLSSLVLCVVKTCEFMVYYCIFTSIKVGRVLKNKEIVLVLIFTFHFDVRTAPLFIHQHICLFSHLYFMCIKSMHS